MTRCLLTAGFVLFAFSASASYIPPGMWDTWFLTEKADLGSQVVVLQRGEQCRLDGTQECRKQLEKWRKQRGVHPVVLQTIDREIARLDVLDGKRAAGERRVEELGYLAHWHIAMYGKPVRITSDPVTGLVRPGTVTTILRGRDYEVSSSFRARSDGRIALRLGAANVDAVCMDGNCLSPGSLSYSVFDAQVLNFDLKQGDHNLVIRFNGDGVGKAFTARLTAPDGKNLKMNTKDGWLEVNPAETRGSLPVNRGPLDVLLTDTGARPHRALLSCRMLRSLGRAQSESVHTVFEGLTLSEPPMLAAALECSAGTMDAARFRNALEALPESDPFRVLALLNEHVNARETARALDLLQQFESPQYLLSLPPAQQAEALGLIQRTWAQAGFSTTGTYKVLELTQHITSWTPELCALQIENLRNTGRADISAEKGVQCRKMWPGDTTIASTLQVSLDQANRHGDALALARDLAKETLDPGFAIDLGRRLFFSSDPGWDVFLESAVASFPENDGLLKSAASIYYRAGKVDKAAEMWRRAYTIRPDESLSSLLSVLGQSPQGSESDFRIDYDEIAESLNNLPDTIYTRYVGLVDRTSLELRPNNSNHLTRTQAIYVADPDPANPLVLMFTYHNDWENAEIIKSVVVRNDGSLIQPTSISEAGLSDPQYNMYYNIRKAAVVFGNLQAGDVVIFAYKIDSVPSVINVPFSGIVHISDVYPKNNVRLDIVAPEDRDVFVNIATSNSELKHVQTYIIKENKQFMTYKFGHVPRIPDETFAPGIFETGSYVYYSTIETAEAFGEWWIGLAMSQTRWDKSMDGLVEKIRKDNPTKESMIEAACKYAADEIRYVGLEVDEYGLKPHTPVEVFHNKFGDCKDKSLFLVALLEKLGVKANVVILTTANAGNTPPDLGVSGFFDHAIVYIPEQDRYFDPTARYVSNSLLPWADQGATGLVLEPGSVRRVVLPIEGPGVSKVKITVDARQEAEAGGSWIVAGQFDFTGQYVWKVQAWTEDEGSWRQSIEYLASAIIPGTQIIDVSHNLVPGKNPVLTVQFSARWNPGNQAQPLLQGLASMAAVTDDPKRTIPVFFGYPYAHEVTVTLQGEGIQVGGAKPEDFSGQDVDYHVSVQQSTNQVTLRADFSQKSRIVPVERYDSWRAGVFGWRRNLSTLTTQVVHGL